jgi:hypothetical protein
LCGTGPTRQPPLPLLPLCERHIAARGSAAAAPLVSGAGLLSSSHFHPAAIRVEPPLPPPIFLPELSSPRRLCSSPCRSPVSHLSFISFSQLVLPSSARPHPARPCRSLVQHLHRSAATHRLSLPLRAPPPPATSGELPPLCKMAPSAAFLLLVPLAPPLAASSP